MMIAGRQITVLQDEDNLSEGVARLAQKISPEFSETTDGWPEEFGSPLADASHPDATIVVGCLPSDDHIDQVLSCRGISFFQCSEHQTHHHQAELLNRLTLAPVNSISLCSSTLHNNQIETNLLNGIAYSITSDIEDMQMITIVLNELVRNAVVHGNLELPSPIISSIDDLDNFAVEIDQRLAVPDFGLRRTTLSFIRDRNDYVVAIENEGAGYPSDDPVTASGDNRKRYTGRGLDIVKSQTKAMHVDKGGRRTIVRF